MRGKKVIKKRPEICLSLSCGTMEEFERELAQYKNYCQSVEWCVDSMEEEKGYTRETFLSQLRHVKALCAGKKLVVDHKGPQEQSNKIQRWAVGVADIIDIDYNNSQITQLIREAKRKKTKVQISYHCFEGMMSRDAIAEQYLRMEKLGGDILKIACMAKEEIDTHVILEAAAAYSQLRKAKPIIAIAMGEAGQTSRICAGDFGSVTTYACGTNTTAPGQFNARELSKYLDIYYEEK